VNGQKSSQLKSRMHAGWSSVNQLESMGFISERRISLVLSGTSPLVGRSDEVFGTHKVRSSLIRPW
jgi:hypothetical protein